MAGITITFNGTAADLNDFCVTMGYADTVPNPVPKPAVGEPGHDTWTATIPNPETKVAFFTRKTKEYVWKTVYGYRLKAAVNAASVSVPEVNF